MIRMICVGGVREIYFTEGVAYYTEALKKRGVAVSSVEVPETQTPDNPAEAAKGLYKEGSLVLKRVKKTDFVIALDKSGVPADNKNIDIDIDIGIGNNFFSPDMIFIIGGSNGLCERVKQRANKLLSFSNMTFPRQIMRLVFLDWALGILSR